MSISENQYVWAGDRLYKVRKSKSSTEFIVENVLTGHIREIENIELSPLFIQLGDIFTMLCKDNHNYEFHRTFIVNGIKYTDTDTAGVQFTVRLKRFFPVIAEPQEEWFTFDWIREKFIKFKDEDS